MMIEHNGRSYDVDFCFTPAGEAEVRTCPVILDDDLPVKGCLFVQSADFALFCRSDCPRDQHVHVHPTVVELLGSVVI